MIVVGCARGVRSWASVCVLFTAVCRSVAVGDGSAAASGTVPEKASIKLKIGALFDMRARHLVEAFQLAVEEHNREELQTHRGLQGSGQQDEHQEEEEEASRTLSEGAVSIIFDPVITFVDVTDSFAVSNAMCDLIAHDVIAIVGITNASSLPTIQSYSATFHVPFLSLGSSQNVTSAAPFQLSLRPPVMAAVVDLLHHQGCSSALYMYDSDEGLMRIQDLFQAINIRELYLELDVRRIGDRAHVTEISKIIGCLHPRREICLVLDVERLDAREIISVVHGGASTVKDIILVTLDAEMALNSFLQDPEHGPRGFNISGLQLVPSLQPSGFVPIHPHLHSTHSFHHHHHHHHHQHRWSPTLSNKEEQRKEYDVTAHLERGLKRSPHSQLKPFRWRESGGGEAHRKREGQSSSEESGSDSKRRYSSGSSPILDDSKRGHHRSWLGSSRAEPKRDRPRGSGFGTTSERSAHPSHPPDPDSHTDERHQRGLASEPKDHTSWEPSPAQGQGAGDGVEASSRTPPVVRSCEALIMDCLKVMTAALADLWDTLGEVLGSSSEESPEDMSIKCTNFVVEKKQYGADLMQALRLVHIQGETRYISFDTGGKREDYTLSVLSVRAGSTVVRNEGEWSSVTGLTSEAWSREGVRSYTIFGNISAPGRRVLLGVTE